MIAAPSPQESQTTLLGGVVWWFGDKKGAW
jgi:hypothetical protein